jgi:Tfp pilus assembly protein PilO
MMLLQTPPPSLPDLPQVHDFPAPPFWVTLPPEAITIIVLAIVVGSVIVLWPLMRALARRLEGRSAPDPATLAEVQQLRSRMAELEQLPHRMADLEERLDFAERLLSQNREVQRLDRGAS